MNYLQDYIPATLPDYNLRYRIGRYGRHGNRVRVHIYERDDGLSAANPENLNGTRAEEPVVVSMSFMDGGFLRPVVGTQCHLSIVVDTYTQLLQLATADETKYMVEVYENYDTANELLVFWGYINPESYEQDYDTKNPTVRITAVDGLQLLQNIKFDPPPDLFSYYQGQPGALLEVHQLKYVIAYLLSVIGNRYHYSNMIPWRWSATNATMGERLLDAAVDLSDYWGLTCFDVLSDIMNKFKSQMLQAPVIGGTFTSIYAIRLMDDALTNINDVFSVYTRTGDWHSEFAKTGNPDWPLNILTMQVDTQRIRGSITSEAAVRELALRNVVDPVDNLVWNGDFKYGKNNWFPPAPGDDDKYGISPGGYMTILSANHWATESTKKITARLKGWHTNLTGWPWQVRFRIRFQAKRRHVASPYLPFWFFRAELHNDSDSVHHNFYFQGTGFGWESFDYLFPSFVNPKNLSIHAINEGFADQELHIKDIRLYCEQVLVSQPATNEPVDEETEHELHPKSIRRVTETIAGQKFNQFAYNNLIVRDFSFTDFAFVPWDVRRINTAGSRKSLTAMIEDRIKEYYARKRRKVTVDFIARSGRRLSGLTLMQDLHMNATFCISSMTRNMTSGITQAQMFEYADYIFEAPAGSSWLIADGLWTDAGVWDDTETWTEI